MVLKSGVLLIWMGIQTLSAFFFFFFLILFKWDLCIIKNIVWGQYFALWLTNQVSGSKYLF